MRETQLDPRGSNINHAANRGKNIIYRFNMSRDNDYAYGILAEKLAEMGFGKGLKIDWYDDYNAKTYIGILSAYYPHLHCYFLSQRKSDIQKSIHILALERYANSV
ncbi:MAG: hypothetical protein Q7R95_03330 [bacterium]|nr:hypothetical protein [bacterium]